MKHSCTTTNSRKYPPDRNTARRTRVNLDGSYLTQRILSIFSTALQRKTLESCITQNKRKSDWKLRSTLFIMDNLISTKGPNNETVDKNDRNDNITTYHLKNPRRVPSQNILPLSSQQHCMFCNYNTHKSATCTKFSGVLVRQAFMLQQKRSLNCGRKGHSLNECTCKGCRNYEGRKDHHALCTKYASTSIGRITPQYDKKP